MRKKILSVVVSTVVTTILALQPVCLTYAETKDVPSIMNVTTENLFDGTSGIAVNIPASIPLSVNSETNKYEFTDYISASGIVYVDQALTVAISNSSIQYVLDTDHTIAINGTANLYNGDIAGTQVVYQADELATNYKEEKAGTPTNEVTNKNKLQVFIDMNDVGYLGNYTGTVIFDTTLSEHVDN